MHQSDIGDASARRAGPVEPGSRSSRRLPGMLRAAVAVGVVLAATVVATRSASAADNPYQRGPDPTVASVAATYGTFATAQINVAPGNGFNGGTIYYPTDTSQGTFAALVIAPGFTETQSAVSWLGPRLASFGFVPTRSEGIAVVETTTLVQFLRTEASHFGARLCDPNLAAAIGPSLMGILAFNAANVRMGLRGGVALLVAVAAPFAMHAVAWDTERIWTYVIPGALLATWILMETRATRPLPAWSLLVALPVLLLNTSNHVPMMDGEWDRFTDPVRLLLYLPTLVFVIAVIGKNRQAIRHSLRQWNRIDPFQRLALMGMVIAVAVNGAFLSASHGIPEWIGWAAYYAGVQSWVLVAAADWIPRMRRGEAIPAYRLPEGA